MKTEIKDNVEHSLRSAICEACHASKEAGEVRTFVVPEYVCAVSHAACIGETIVRVCNDCVSFRGVPTQIYIGDVQFHTNWNRPGFP